MECLDIEEIVQYACDDLGEAERALADLHLRACEECQRELAVVRGIVAHASDLGRRKLSAWRARAVMQAAEELLPLDPAQRREEREEREKAQVLRRAPAQALAACAMAAIIAGVALPKDHEEVAPKRICLEERIKELLGAEEPPTAGAGMRLFAEGKGGTKEGSLG